MVKHMLGQRDFSLPMSKVNFRHCCDICITQLQQKPFALDAEKNILEETILVKCPCSEKMNEPE